MTCIYSCQFFIFLLLEARGYTVISRRILCHFLITFYNERASAYLFSLFVKPVLMYSGYRINAILTMCT